MTETLKSTHLFEDTDEKIVADIAKFSEKLTYSDGDKLFTEVTEDDYDLYLLVKGTMHVLAQYSGRTAAKETKLASVDQEVFGEMAWLLKSKRSAVITCEGDTEVIKIDGSKLDNYLNDHPDVGFQLTKKMATILANRLLKIHDLAKMYLGYFMP